MILVFAFILEGCSATTIVGPESSAANHVAMSYGKLNRVLNDGLNNKATIIFADGRECEAEQIQVGKDSTQFVDVDSGGARRVNTSNILRIERTDRFSGAVEGLFLGALGGGAVGFGLGSLSSDEGEWSGFGKAILAGLGVFAGGSVGLIIGVVRGHHSGYEFAQDTVAAPRGEKLR